MVDIDRHVAEAQEHVAEAKKWGYSPDPWAETIVALMDPLAGPRQPAAKVLRFLVDLNEASNGRYERAVQAMHEVLDND